MFVNYTIMKLLELFSGTSKVAKMRGFDVVSLDLKNAVFDWDDILHWNNK